MIQGLKHYVKVKRQAYQGTLCPKSFELFTYFVGTESEGVLRLNTSVLVRFELYWLFVSFLEYAYARMSYPSTVSSAVTLN